jgi:hypothetical protein
MRWACDMIRMRKRRKSRRIVVGKSKENKQLGRTRPRGEGNIKMDLKRDRMGGHRMVKSGTGHGQTAGCCEHGNENSGSIQRREIFSS